MLDQLITVAVLKGADAIRRKMASFSNERAREKAEVEREREKAKRERLEAERKWQEAELRRHEKHQKEQNEIKGYCRTIYEKILKDEIALIVKENPESASFGSELLAKLGRKRLATKAGMDRHMAIAKEAYASARKKWRKIKGECECLRRNVEQMGKSAVALAVSREELQKKLDNRRKAFVQWQENMKILEQQQAHCDKLNQYYKVYVMLNRNGNVGNMEELQLMKLAQDLSLTEKEVGEVQEIAFRNGFSDETAPFLPKQKEHPCPEEINSPQTLEDMDAEENRLERMRRDEEAKLRAASAQLQEIELTLQVNSAFYMLSYAQAANGPLRITADGLEFTGKDFIVNTSYLDEGGDVNEKRKQETKTADSLPSSVSAVSRELTKAREELVARLATMPPRNAETRSPH